MRWGIAKTKWGPRMNTDKQTQARSSVLSVFICVHPWPNIFVSFFACLASLRETCYQYPLPSTFFLQLPQNSAPFTPTRSTPWLDDITHRQPAQCRTPNPSPPPQPAPSTTPPPSTPPP